MGASAGREQMLTGTPGKVAFIFPHFLLNRISDQGHQHWFAFCWNSAFSFKFSSMILSLGTFHLSFPSHSTCLSRNACVSATEWGRMDYVLSLKSKLSPSWEPVEPSHPFLNLARSLEWTWLVFCGQLHWTCSLKSTVACSWNIVRYRQRLWEIRNCSALFRNLKSSWKCFASNKHTIFIKLREKCFE